MATSSLTNRLKARATNWAGQLTSLARSYAPAHLREYITSKTEDSGEATFIIRITANRFANPTAPGHPNYGSSDARAQEYGSGLKSRRPSQQGGSHTNTITGNPFLTFFWEKANPNIHKTKEGKVVLNSVEHPGIQAANNGQGYIAPAVKELRAKAKSDLDADVYSAIMSDTRTAFGHANK